MTDDTPDWTLPLERRLELWAQYRDRYPSAPAADDDTGRQAVSPSVSA